MVQIREEMVEKKRLAIVIPVYNDWQSLSFLLTEISNLLTPSYHQIKVLIVNDASTDEIFIPSPLNIQIEILHLISNLGHQKAIAIGIAHLAHQEDNDFVVVMDGDGEDDPADIQLFREASEQSPNSIVFARRSKRSDGALFGLFYVVYKMIFKIFTGHMITFGNFCLIPGNRISRLAHVSEIWNHFSCGIIRSKLPFKTIRINRRKRSMGKPKMNLISLVIHGISSISVYIDVASVRLLIFFAGLILLSVSGIFGVIFIRLYTDLAIPGWASTIGIGLILVVLQLFFISLILSFIILSHRSQMQFIPALHYKDYILKIDTND